MVRSRGDALDGDELAADALDADELDADDGLIAAVSSHAERASESDPAGRAGARRHALWALTVLVLLAVLVIAVTLFFSGTPGTQHEDRIQLGIPTTGARPTQSPSSAVGTPRRSTGRSSAPARRPSTLHRPTSAAAGTSTAPVHPPAPTRPAGDIAGAAAAPCAGSTPCVVPGDGGIAAALNAARHSRGAGAARVVVTSTAQRCAASGGAQCAGQYAIQTATAQSGRQAVLALAASPGNAWLFDPATLALQAGWAYLPGLHEYVVALLGQ